MVVGERVVGEVHVILEGEVTEPILAAQLARMRFPQKFRADHACAVQKAAVNVTRGLVDLVSCKEGHVGES